MILANRLPLKRKKFFELVGFRNGVIFVGINQMEEDKY